MFYACQRCTACCRWPGQVPVSDQEIARMAAHLGMEERVFIELYTVLRPARDGLSLRSLPDHACSLLDGDNCIVHPVKPDQCVGFPNRWNFPGWREVCRAIPVESSDDEHRAS